MTIKRTGGYTLIEVMTSVLLLSSGLLAACILILYGIRIAQNTRDQAIGMATAASLAVDAKPQATEDETSMQPNATGKGYINGLWVERREQYPVQLDDQGKMWAVTIRVDVYASQGSASTGGKCLASTIRRVIRQQP